MKKLRLTIKATNGATWETSEFQLNQPVHVVLKRAVQHFIKGGAMSAGEYALALVVGGQAVELDDGDKLGEANVIDGSVLAIFVRGAQVDGSESSPR